MSLLIEQASTLFKDSKTWLSFIELSKNSLMYDKKLAILISLNSIVIPIKNIITQIRVIYVTITL